MLLVNSPDAEGFMQRLGTDVGRKVALGDRSQYDGRALNLIAAAHNAVIEGVPKIIALASDPTRTTVQQHHSARQIATKIGAAVIQSKTGLEGVARELMAEGEQAILERFALDPNRHAIHSEMRGWIRGRAVEADGIMKIREAAKTNSELVGVIHGSPNFLLDLSETTRENIVTDGFARFAAGGWAKIEESQRLNELAARYAKFPDMVHLYSYNRELANQANRRVEL